jgi:transposase
MPNPVVVVIELTEEERAQLQAWARRPTSAQALAQRSRIVLLAAEGLKNTDVAQRLGITRKMATKWRARCATDRLDGLLDELRPGQPRTVSDEHVERSSPRPWRPRRNTRRIGRRGRWPPRLA